MKDDSGAQQQENSRIPEAVIRPIASVGAGFLIIPVGLVAGSNDGLLQVDPKEPEPVEKRAKKKPRKK